MKNKRTSWISLAALSSVAIFSGCSKSGATVPLSESCPQDLEQIERTSFEVEEPTATVLRSGFVASQQVQVLAGTLEQDLLAACTALAKDLFVSEKQLEPQDFSQGNEVLQACTLASEAVEKLKGLAGGTLSVNVGPTFCKTPMSASSPCFSACGGSAPVVACDGQVSGACPGKCDGQCTLEGQNDCTGSCSGTCSGACDSEFKGTCRGACEGWCDGKEATGECPGTCEGRCMEGARGACGGTCLGECQGSCTVEAAGECEGICEGECDKPLVEKHCVGTVSIPDSASDCAASCGAGLLSELTCQPPSIEVTIEAAKNEDAAELLKTALTQHLPEILASRAIQTNPKEVEKISSRAKSLIEALVPELEALGDEVSGKSKTCAEETTKNSQTALSALPTIMSATDYARGINAD